MSKRKHELIDLEECRISHLPLDPLKCVFWYFGLLDSVRLRRTCKAWKDAIDSMADTFKEVCIGFDLNILVAKRDNIIGQPAFRFAKDLAAITGYPYFANNLKSLWIGSCFFWIAIADLEKVRRPVKLVLQISTSDVYSPVRYLITGQPEEKEDERLDRFEAAVRFLLGRVRKNLRAFYLSGFYEGPSLSILDSIDPPDSNEIEVGVRIGQSGWPSSQLNERPSDLCGTAKIILSKYKRILHFHSNGLNPSALVDVARGSKAPLEAVFCLSRLYRENGFKVAPAIPSCTTPECLYMFGRVLSVNLDWVTDALKAYPKIRQLSLNIVYLPSRDGYEKAVFFAGMIQCLPSSLEKLSIEEIPKDLTGLNLCFAKPLKSLAVLEVKGHGDVRSLGAILALAPNLELLLLRFGAKNTRTDLLHMLQASLPPNCSIYFRVFHKDLMDPEGKYGLKDLQLLKELYIVESHPLYLHHYRNNRFVRVDAADLYHPPRARQMDIRSFVKRRRT